MPLRPETRARARAVQLLYLWDAQGRPPLDRVVVQGAALFALPTGVAGRVRVLLESATAYADSIDARIAALTEHWRLERLGAVDRAILRLAMAELDEGETPPRVVIDEAVRLAHWFGGGKSPAFVNGVLDAAARALHRL